MKELWQLKYPCAGQVKGLRRTPLEWLRRRMHKNKELPWRFRV